MIEIKDCKTVFFYWPKDVFYEKKNSKTNERHKSILNLSQRSDLKSSNKHANLQNISIYHTWKIKKKNSIRIVN